MIFLILGILFSIPTFSQSKADSIRYWKAFGGYKFAYNKQVLKTNQLMDLMQTNAEAYSYMQKAKTNSNVSTVLGIAGGFLIGWPIGTTIGGGEPNWVLAGVGAGLIVLSIPLIKGYNKNAIKAAQSFNSSLKGVSTTTEYSFNLGINSSGLGLTLGF